MNWLVFLSSRSAHGAVGMVDGGAAAAAQDFGADGALSPDGSLRVRCPDSSARGARGAAGGGAFNCALGAVGAVFGTGDEAIGALKGALVGRISGGAFQTFEVGPA